MNGGRRRPPPGVPAKKEVRRLVEADPRWGNGEEAAGEQAHLAAHHHTTNAGISREWSKAEGTQEKEATAVRGDDI
jgi:hypothetical protein